MYHVDNSTGVPVMPQPSPVTSETELFFTEGGNGVPPTFPGPDWFNIIQSELINILRAAGLDPDKMDNTQILAALKKLFLSRSNPFGDIKADGAAAIATALSNLRLGAFISSPSTEPGNFSQVNSPDGKSYLFIANNKNWGAQTEDGKAIPLSLERGGSGAGTPEGAREAFGLGNSATKNIGTTAGTVAAGDDSRLVNLKSAANRSVGNGANQIPDMSYFTTGETSSGRWAKLPSGLIIQAGFGLTSPAGTATVNLPIPFTGTFYVVGGSIEGNGPIFVSARGLTQSTIGVVAWGRDGSIQVTNMHWLAIGV
ncbi:TPA: gp53-like domain-containing protein [Escherichia coli]